MRVKIEMAVVDGCARIAAVVVTFNRKALLQENIAALQSQDYAGAFDIIIVDNASTDGTAEMVAALQAEVPPGGCLLYRNTGANLGGAGGFQYGVRYAAEHGYGYIWLMDDDSMPQKGALSALMRADMELGGRYGWLSSQARWTDDTPCAMNVQKNGLLSKVRDWESPLVPAVFATFVSLFLRTSVVKQMGLPIKEFFIWSDDFEYTRRISRRYACYVCNTSIVVHKTASNIGSNLAVDTRERLPRYMYMYRNEIYICRREGLAGWCFQIARLLWHIARVLLGPAGDARRRLGFLCRGTWAGLHFNPAIEFPLGDCDEDC